MLGSTSRTFGPKGFADGAALAVDPAGVAATISVTITSTNERSAADRTRNI